MQTLNTIIQILTVVSALGAVFTYCLGKSTSITDERKRQVDESFGFFMAAFLFFGAYNLMTLGDK